MSNLWSTLIQWRRNRHPPHSSCWRDLQGRLVRGAYSAKGFTSLTLTERTHFESGHAQVSNETGGVQTPKVALTGSLNWLRSKREFSYDELK